MTDQANIQAPAGAGAIKARLRFERLPAAYIHADHLGRCLPDGMPANARDRLLKSGRLQSRLSGLLIRRFDLKPCAPEDLAAPEGRFVQLEGEALTSAVRLMGAILHGRTIAAIILASALKELVAWLGREAHREALRQAPLALAEVNQDVVGEQPDIPLLRRLIERDGHQCLRVWCDHQPDALAKRLLLKFPLFEEAAAETSDSLNDRRLAIADRVVMSRMANHGA